MTPPASEPWRPFDEGKVPRNEWFLVLLAKPMWGNRVWPMVVWDNMSMIGMRFAFDVSENGDNRVLMWRPMVALPQEHAQEVNDAAP
jgi:hypothetical protein